MENNIEKPELKITNIAMDNLGILKEIECVIDRIKLILTGEEEKVGEAERTITGLFDNETVINDLLKKCLDKLYGIDKKL